MGQAKCGDMVKVNYIGKLDDGTIFYNSDEKGALQFKVGNEEVIVGFEDAIIGMKAGESKIIRVSADKAYGPFRKELIAVIPRDEFPKHITPEVGQILQITQSDGVQIFFRVTEVCDLSVTVDGNHPLAGKDLTYEIQLLEICPAM
ncbi:MAG: peptidylprolyl isomerase [Planctomycetes bacterium]|nr:peptidylprolyl isomerase [Planctomycetota bacterium]